MKTLLRYLVCLLLLCSMGKLPAQSYTIPMVFHVLHQGGPENISDAQIIDAVRILNEDYNKQNADTANVLTYYQNNMADMQITFRLAGLDPNGNVTNGIDRIFTPLTNDANDSAKLNQWNPHQYLNIWVVTSLQNGIRAYAYYPWTVTSQPQKDGVMVLSSSVGSIGTSNGGRGRALTHEIGHYLCLLHPSGWGDSNCADNDSVADTHDSKGYLTCSDTVPALQCIPGIPTNYQTFMDYSYCSCMFTNGQKARAHNCLNNYRDDLIMPTNLIATGTTGLNQQQGTLQGLRVAPNPFTGWVSVSGLPYRDYSVSVFDIAGRKIADISNQRNNNNSLDVDLSHVVAKGVYILKLTDSNGQSSAVKLVRE